MAFKFKSDKATTGFGPLPNGDYEVIVFKAGADYSSKKGTPFIDMQLAIREDAPNQSEYKGRRVFHRLFFTENTEGLVHGFLKAVGTPEDTEFAQKEDDNYLTLMKSISDFIIGKPLQVKLKIYEGNDGNEYNEVSSVKPSELSGTSHPIESSRTKDDPFENGGPIDISDDDLPF